MHGLVLSRRGSEGIVCMVGADVIAIRVVEIKGCRAKLQFAAGPHVKILREELLEPEARDAIFGDKGTST